MEKELLSIRVNDKLFKEFKIFCQEQKITITTAINYLVDSCIENKKLPFELGGKNGSFSDYEGCSTRKSVYFSKEKKERFCDFCENYCFFTMADVLKAFMIYCVSSNPQLPVLKKKGK